MRFDSKGLGLAKQSGFYLIGRALPALVGLGSVALYTRLLDPASVGAYALLLSTSLLASSIAYSWLRVAALRLGASTKDQLEPDFAATLTLLFAITSFAIAAVEGLGLYFFYRPSLALPSLGLAVAAAVASAWYELNGTMLQARLSVVSWGTLNLCRTVAALVFSVVLIYAGFKTNALLAGFVLGNSATLLFSSMWWPARRGKFDGELFARLFRVGWPSSIAAVLSLLSPAFQRYVLAAFAGASAVGIYAVSQDFATQSMMTLVGSISLAGIPLAFKAKDSGESEAVSRQLRANASLIFAIALPAALGLAAMAGPISHTFLGPRFRDGAPPVIAMLAIATFVAGLRTYYFDQAFLLALKTRPQVTISAIATAVLMGLTFVMVPRFGVVGAAASSLVSSTVGIVLSAVWGRTLLHVPIPLRSWAKTALATGGMVLAVTLVPVRGGIVGLVAVLILGAIVYAMLSMASRLGTVRSHLGGRFA